MPVSRKKLFLVAVSIFLMGQVLARVDWERMREAFLGVDIGLFVSSTFLAVALGGIFGVRLHAVFAGTPLQGGLLRFVRISYVACYYALFLPAGLGSEVSRWYQIAGGSGHSALFWSGILMERAMLFLLLLALACAPALLHADPDVLCVEMALMLLVFFVPSLGLFLLFTRQGVRDVVLRLSGSVARILPCAASFGRRIPETPLHVFPRQTVLKVLVWSLVWLLVFVARAYVLARSLGLPFDVIAVARMGALAFFLEMLPISYAGLGLREGVFVQLFAAQGVAGTLGIAYGLAFFAQFLIIGAFGGLCTLCRRGDGPVKSPAQAE